MGSFEGEDLFYYLYGLYLSCGSISVAVAGTGVAIEGKVRVGCLWQVPSAR